MITEKITKQNTKRSRGGRNLLLLGAGSILTSLMTVGIALTIYHNSGDIYIDRSRPGFLPDKKEVETEEPERDYKYPDNTDLSEENLKKFLVEYEKMMGPVRREDATFDTSALSDSTVFGENVVK